VYSIAPPAGSEYDCAQQRVKSPIARLNVVVWKSFFVAPDTVIWYVPVGQLDPTFTVTVDVPPLGIGIVEGLRVGVPQEAGRFDEADKTTVSAGAPTTCETVIVVVVVEVGYPFVGFGEADRTKVP
jgi:hypothetical protein